MTSLRICFSGFLLGGFVALCVPTQAMQSNPHKPLTRADGRCWPSVQTNQRYVDCGNGTITDEVTGLIWLKDSTCLGLHTYAEGNMAAQSLHDGQCGLIDSSSAGQWRLPTIAEWQTTIRQAIALGCVAPDGSQPVLTANNGLICYSGAPDGDGPGFWQRAFPGVRAMLYWSSTTAEANPVYASAIGLSNGNVYTTSTPSEPLGIWPVRSN